MKPAEGSGGDIEVELRISCSEEVDGDRWSRLLAVALASEGVGPGAEVGLGFVTPEAMAELNRVHLGGVGPTDVLAFPLDGPEVVGAGAEGIGGTAPAPTVALGDVVICPAVATANAPGHAGTVEDEIALLVVHGALHLLGHDHVAEDERALMQDRERALLSAHHGVPVRDPWADELH